MRPLAAKRPRRRTYLPKRLATTVATTATAAAIAMIVAATKIDSANPEKLKKLTAHAKRRKLEFYAISAVTGQGIDELKWAVARRVFGEEEK